MIFQYIIIFLVIFSSNYQLYIFFSVSFLQSFMYMQSSIYLQSSFYLQSSMYIQYFMHIYVFMYIVIYIMYIYPWMNKIFFQKSSQIALKISLQNQTNILLIKTTFIQGVEKRIGGKYVKFRYFAAFRFNTFYCILLPQTREE